MLPFLYPEIDPAKILEDVEASEIPALHKAMFAWIKEFTLSSSHLTQEHIQSLRDLGVQDVDIVEWANVAATQTWFVMSADGGGIPLEGDAVVGSVIGLERENYHCRNHETVPAAITTGARTCANSCCWVATNETNLQDISSSTMDRYQFMPNLLKAVSITPHMIERHARALELLEGPQSESLTPRLHAMVRRLVNRRNQADYFDDTTRELLLKHCDNDLVFDFTGFSEMEQVVLNFADKMVKQAYKVTAKDAASFRDMGLDDEAYVDVINTVSIQTSLDRLCNALGVQADSKPLIAG